MTVPHKQPGQIRGFQPDANTAHMSESVSRRPDAVVVDDHMAVEVRLQEGPSGAVAGSRLEPSRGPEGQQSFIQASTLPFKLKVICSSEFIMKLLVQILIMIVSRIFNINIFFVLK